MTTEQNGPQVSDDGRYWWDGNRWQAIQTPGGRRMPGQVLPTPVLMTLVALATVAALVFALFLR